MKLAYRIKAFGNVGGQCDDDGVLWATYIVVVVDGKPDPFWQLLGHISDCANI